MITIYDDTGYSSTDDDDCTPAFEFKLPDCTLPDFLDNTMKWSQCEQESYMKQMITALVQSHAENRKLQSPVSF